MIRLRQQVILRRLAVPRLAVPRVAVRRLEVLRLAVLRLAVPRVAVPRVAVPRLVAHVSLVNTGVLKIRFLSATAGASGKTSTRVQEPAMLLAIPIHASDSCQKQSTNHLALETECANSL
jgi:hypothetical protein